MSANVEMMFSVREAPWHYSMYPERTKIIQEAPDSREALIAAGLNWKVISEPVHRENGDVIPGFKANVRDSDNKCLGVVSERYKVVQNEDAFAFTDSLIGETDGGVVRYETAGSLQGGKKVWLLARMPTVEVVGDKVDPFMCFANSFDGSGAVQVCSTPIRVCCQNTLNMALSSAKRKWSTKHVGDIESKMEEARMCLQMSDKYMKALDEDADRLANSRLYKEQVDEILEELFPVDDEMSDRKRANIETMKENYQICYFAPDILKFGESGWRAVNAMGDMITHCEPIRETKTFEENRWGKIMDGHAIFDKFVELVNAKVMA